ncbi:hypothetical protein A5663_02955 [Mycobacterium sp. E740]|nr:hypothetical protein A5663_02955 [Mycobacterium sp. E740]
MATEASHASAVKDMRRLRWQLFFRGAVTLYGSSSATEMVYLTHYAQHARLVAEIGFNAGQSAYAMLIANPDLEVVSFDLGAHRAIKVGKRFIDERFPGRHTLILGDSKTTVPEYRAAHPETVFDVVFVDGGHDYDTAAADLANMRELSSPATTLIMDDLVPGMSYGIGPMKAWSEAVEQGMIRESERVRNGRRRGWGRGHYVARETDTPT